MIDINQKEEDILKVLWNRGEAFVKDIIEDLKWKPKPPYNTVSSIVRRMVDKELVGYKTFGKTHQYYAKLTKAEIKNIKASKLLSDYFDNSFTSMVSHYVKDGSADLEELSELLKRIKNQE